jgi:hypothetical protein
MTNDQREVHRKKRIPTWWSHGGTVVGKARGSLYELATGSEVGDDSLPVFACLGA